METELRRRRIELITLGGGIIAFGVWSVLKTFLYVWVDSGSLTEQAPEESKTAVMVLSIVIIAIIVLIDLALRCYIGLSARAEGIGQDKGRTYIVLAAVMLVLGILSWIPMLINFGGQDQAEKRPLLDFLISLVVDATSLTLMGKLLYNAVKVKKLRRQLEG